MKIIATAKHGVAIGLLYGLALTCLSAWADEPVTKEPEKAPSSKPIEPPKAVEPKAADPKAPETKSPPSKAAEPPKESPKAADKTPEAKVPDAKISTPPAPSPKSADTKSAEPAKPPMPPIVAIKLALMSDPRLFPYEINVDMNGETATLSGKVGSEAEKTAALEIAQAVETFKVNAEQKATYEKLSKLSGQQFDHEFAQHMVQDHKKDINAFEQESKKSGKVASFAQDALPVLRKHLQIAESLNSRGTTGSAR